jgi:hypothetical protein
VLAACSAIKQTPVEAVEKGDEKSWRGVNGALLKETAGITWTGGKRLARPETPEIRLQAPFY